MASSYELITRIQEHLGTVCDRDLAERIYTELRADDRIYWDNVRGLVLRDDVDLFAVAVGVLGAGMAQPTGPVALPPAIGGALDAAPIKPLWSPGRLPDALL